MSAPASATTTSPPCSARVGWARSGRPPTPSSTAPSPLKILPDAFAADPDRLARFQREAQILASLNHPNIAAIHGIEEAEGTRALVLELVEGPTLADRRRGAADCEARERNNSHPERRSE